MPQASTQAEHLEAQREERAARSSSLRPSLSASPADLESHRCSCSCSLLFIGMAEGGRLLSRPRPFPPMSLSPFPSGRALPFPRVGCPVQLGHGLGCTQSLPCRDPHLPRDLGSAWCSSPGCQHQKVKLSLEQCVALPTGAWQSPHRPHRTCSPWQSSHRSHRTCSTCRVWGHRAVCGGDRAVPAGVTMPVRTPWALKSPAEPCLRPEQGRTQVPTWLPRSRFRLYKAGRNMAGIRPWGVS